MNAPLTRRRPNLVRFLASLGCSLAFLTAAAVISQWELLGARANTQVNPAWTSSAVVAIFLGVAFLVRALSSVGSLVCAACAGPVDEMCVTHHLPLASGPEAVDAARRGDCTRLLQLASPSTILDQDHLRLVVRSCRCGRVARLRLSRRDVIAGVTRDLVRSPVILWDADSPADLGPGLTAVRTRLAGDPG